MKISKIEIDRNLCIGAASCMAVAPEAFELDAENKAILKNPSAETAETILDAAKACPTLAIKVYDENGKLIFPEAADVAGTSTPPPATAEAAGQPSANQP